MFRGLRVAVAGMAIFVAGAAAAEGPDWSGTYTYSEQGGRTAGGTGIVVGHTIAVTREGGRYKAEITASGYQTRVQIFAVGEAAGTKLALRFEKDGDDQVFKNQYQSGALLLELERASDGRLLTHWRALTPATRERFPNPGFYFRRQ